MIQLYKVIFDINHTSGLYLGMWGSNISWLRDPYGNPKRLLVTEENKIHFINLEVILEIDIYGGFKSEIGKTGLGIDLRRTSILLPRGLKEVENVGNWICKSKYH